jgi:L-alanine-DL-glutamate epimerase-like enolase superfamily enzyme
MYMIIKDIVCYTGNRIFFVEVVTDQGISGFGECSPMNNDAVLPLVLKTIKPALLGWSVFDLEKIEERILKRHYKFSGQLLAMAFSGVEIALWDAKAKYCGQPVYNLLGGRYRERVKFYGSSMSRDLSHAEEAAKLRQGIDRFGFEAVKFKVGPRMGTGLPVNLQQDEEKVRIVREAIGPECRMMVDGNSSYTYSQAVQLFERIRQYDVYHYEEPCPYYDVEAYVKLAAALPVPIHVGEQDWNLFTVRDFISRGGCHLYAADLVKCGGFSSARRIAALCRAFGITYAGHNTSRGIGLAAAIQLAASTPEYDYYLEYSIESSEVKDQYMRLDIDVQAGGCEIPSSPGIGVEMDLEKIRKTLTVSV